MPMTPSELVSHSFGLRHRPVADARSGFRKHDVLAGIMLPVVVIVSLGFAEAVFLPGTLPARANSLLTIGGFGLVFVGGTLWKPVLEHLGLLRPSEVAASTRQRIVIVARAIPYVYAITAISIAFMLAYVVGALFATLITQAVGIASGDSSYAITMLGLGGAMGLLTWGFITHTIMTAARRKPDWGLPTWSAWVEPGQQYPAGQEFFGPLDATLGRFARAITA